MGYEIFEELLGPTLLTKVGEFQEKANIRNFQKKKEDFNHGPKQETAKALEGKDLVLLYFSAGTW